MKLHELEDLTNILDNFTVPEIITRSFVLTEDDYVTIVNNLIEQLYDFVCSNIKIYHKKNNYIDSIQEFLCEEFDNIFEYELQLYETSQKDIFCDDVVYDDDYFDDYVEHKQAIIENVIELFHQVVPIRSHKNTCILFTQNEKYKTLIDKSLEYVYDKDKNCPPQKSEQWHKQRYNLISASTAWQILDKDNYRNSYIYDKCKPLDTSKFFGVNVNSPFHWGTKFEPVSQMYYEYIYNVKIEEFGCIPHRDFTFLGASPDGIVVTRDSDRYGRMLEIKNIVNREITGIPKKEYWIQTQYQMECCNLYECDFLECRFKLYENEKTFNDDGDFNKTNDGKFKGIIMWFTVNNEPYYEYMPFQCTEDEFIQWEEQMMKKHENDTWIKNDYWYLQEVSCVLIQRNTHWFKCVKPEFIDTWKTIEYERIHGYEHRKKKKSKNTKPLVVDKKSVMNNKLFDSIMKSDATDTQTTKQDVAQSKIVRKKESNNTLVINIDTSNI